MKHAISAMKSEPMWRVPNVLVFILSCWTGTIAVTTQEQPKSLHFWNWFKNLNQIDQSSYKLNRLGEVFYGKEIGRFYTLWPFTPSILAFLKLASLVIAEVRSALERSAPKKETALRLASLKMQPTRDAKLMLAFLHFAL